MSLDLDRLSRFAALSVRAGELEREAREFTGEDRLELLRESLAVKARMLQLMRGDEDV